MSANTYLPISPVVPPYLLISNVSQTNPMVVTVSTSNGYVVGQVVHLTVPFDYGMFQADQLNGKIIAVDGLNFSLNIDATQFDAFVTPSGAVVKPASLSPAGSQNIYNFNYVPFHSLDGQVGN
jgi:hypothetical protein